MGKFISNVFLGALALGLSIFTGSRTLDLLAWALPANQIIYQWLGLAAYEGGMYFWSFYFVSGAKGVHQRSISLIMAVFSVAAVCIATVADLSLDASQAGKIAPLQPGMQQAMIIFVGITVALNVAAFLACKLMSPEKLREIASGQAEDLIYAEGLRAISAVAPEMAAEAAPHLAAEWSNRTWQRIVPGVQRRTEFLGPVPAMPALPPAPAQAPAALSSGSPAQAQIVASKPPAPAQAPARKKVLGFIPLGRKPAEPEEFHSRTDLAKRAQDDAQAVVDASRARRSTVGTANSRHFPQLQAEYNARQVAQQRRARRQARFRPAAPVFQQSIAPASQQFAEPSPSAHALERRTCSECSTSFEVQANAKKLTCSEACRKARSRRLAAARRGQAHSQKGV